MLLFDDNLPQLEMSPAQALELVHRRRLDRDRQRRCRDRKKGKPSLTLVSAGEEKTLAMQLESVTPETVNVTRVEADEQGALVVAVLARMMAAKEPMGRANIERALKAEFKARGVLLFDVRNFVQSLVDVGALPDLGPVEYVNVPRPVLDALIAEARKGRGQQ